MTRTRLTAEERQEQLIAAAVTAFAAGGYAGTTTDQVARLAGVSQPYVIRIFRTKQELFLAAMANACGRIEEAFRAGAAKEPTLSSLGDSYQDLIDRPELMVLMLHGFAASSDPVIGGQVRGHFGRLYDAVRSLTGCSAEEARDFFAHGMLITVLGAMHVIGPDPVAQDAWMTDLIPTLGEGRVPGESSAAV